MEVTDNNNSIDSTSASADFVVNRFSDFQEADFNDVLLIANSLNTQMGSIFTTQQLGDNIANLNEMLNQNEMNDEAIQVVAGLETVDLLATATQVFEHNVQLNQLMADEELTSQQKQEQAVELIASARNTTYEGATDSVGMFSTKAGLVVEKNAEVDVDSTQDFGDLLTEMPIDNGATFLMEKMGLSNYIESNKEVIREKVFGLSIAETTEEAPVQEVVDSSIEENIEFSEPILEVSEEFVETNAEMEMTGVNLQQENTAEAQHLVAEIENNMNALIQELEGLKSNVGGI